MALRIATVELSDFDNLVATASLNAPGHDIVAPPRSSARPVTRVPRPRGVAAVSWRTQRPGG